MLLQAEGDLDTELTELLTDWSNPSSSSQTQRLSRQIIKFPSQSDSVSQYEYERAISSCLKGMGSQEKVGKARRRKVEIVNKGSDFISNLYLYELSAAQ